MVSSPLCILYWMCQSLALYAARTLTDCWKCSRTISSHCPCNVSSFATVSPAHVRFTEHGSMPSYLAARRLLARRVREWRMRRHLHVSVCSLMTQRSFLSLSLSPHFYALSLSFSGHLVRLLAHLPRVLSQSYSFTRNLLSLRQFPSADLPKKTCLTSIILGKRSKVGSVYLQGNII